MKRTYHLFWICLALSLMLWASACRGATKPDVSMGDLYTAVARTQTTGPLPASSTTTVAEPVATILPETIPVTSAPAASTEPPPATKIPVTEAPPAATLTPLPPSATSTSAGTPAGTAAPTLQSNCTDRVSLAEETYEDGSEVPAGTVFTKTWTLRNTGTCIWTTGYTVLFQSGDPLKGTEKTLTFAREVPPEATYPLSVQLTAPAEAGDYQAKWRLRNDRGQEFGPGRDASGTIWVQISVTGSASAQPPNLNLGEPAWKETFSNSTTRYFSLRSDGDTRMEINEGWLEMTALSQNGDQWRIARTPELSNFYLEMRVKTGPECSGRDGYGLVVRSRESSPDIFNTGYVIAFTCDGKYRIYLMDDGDYAGLVNWKSSGLIKAGPDQTNLIAVEMRGDTLRLYINGVQQAEITDSTISSGAFGPLVRADESDTFKILIDYISYWKLP